MIVCYGNAIEWVHVARTWCTIGNPTKFSKSLSRFRAAEMTFNARSRSLFLAKSRSLSDTMGQLLIALGTLHIDRCSPRKPNNVIQTRQ